MVSSPNLGYLMLILSLCLQKIIAATINRYLCWVYPDDVNWIFWYVREASTAVIVSNLPSCFTLMRRLINLQARSTVGTRLSVRRRSAHIPLDSESQTPGTLKESKHYFSPESLKRTIKGKTSRRPTVVEDQAIPLEIWQQTEYQVEYKEYGEVATSSDESVAVNATRRPPPIFGPNNKSIVTSGTKGRKSLDDFV